MSEKEKEVLQFRYNYQISVVCLPHYEKDVRLWFHKNTKQCRNFFGKHRRTSGNKKLSTKEVNLELAKKARKYTKHEVFPCQRLCQPCLSKLEEEIAAAIEAENDIEEEDVVPLEDVNDPDWKDPDIPEEVETDEATEAADLEEIVANIRDYWPGCNKEQRIAIIKILPKTWSTRHISTKSGLSRRLGKISKIS